MNWNGTLTRAGLVWADAERGAAMATAATASRAKTVFFITYLSVESAAVCFVHEPRTWVAIAKGMPEVGGAPAWCVRPICGRFQGFRGGMSCPRLDRGTARENPVSGNVSARRKWRAPIMT